MAIPAIPIATNSIMLQHSALSSIGTPSVGRGGGAPSLYVGGRISASGQLGLEHRVRAPPDPLHQRLLLVGGGTIALPRIPHERVDGLVERVHPTLSAPQPR